MKISSDLKFRFRLACAWTALCLSIAAVNPRLSWAQAATPKSVSRQAAKEADAAKGSAQAANGAAPGQPTAPNPATAARLAALPKPLPPALTEGIDVDERSKAILAHLSEVIRFYRMAVTPIQKTGEPSDMLYAEQAQATATQIGQLAFQSARDQAALLARIKAKTTGNNAPNSETEAQRLSSLQLNTAKRIDDLQNQDDALDKQIATSRGKQRTALEQQRQVVEGQLQLAQAMWEALGKVTGVSTSQTNSRLQGDIDRLQHAAPELVDSKVKPVTNTIESIGSLRDAGVSSQATVLFQLLGTEHAIDQRIQETQKLHDQAADLRSPLVKILQATVAAGQNLQAQGSTPASAQGQPGAKAAGETNADNLENTKKAYDQLTDAFKSIAGVSVPISQEVLLIEQARANLLSWRAAVDAERTTILRALLLRVLAIALALCVIFAISEVWRRTTTRYVQDLRRRRQLLLIRRLVIGFLTGLVLIFGFVTQFSSLATFAGFITAGLAVGLQTILLSVAAYFFIVGRYGVRVGDRITVANVTGDVVEVGLVRFYMMELTGTGTELHPTGRIAVFANSVLFQTGTPLYKQIPGTDYAWHEVSLKLKPGTDYHAATEAVRSAVQQVYSTYEAQIEQQHKQVEAWMDTALKAPGIESRLQLADGLQYVVLYPVQIRDAAATDGKVVQAVLDAMSKDPQISQTVDGPPTVRAVVKG